MVMRLFVALLVTGSHNLLRVLRVLEGIGAGVNVVRAGNMHVTLRFLGDVEAAAVGGVVEAVRGATEGVGAFALVLRGTGAFPSADRARTVWAGVEDSAALRGLVGRLEEALVDAGYPPAGRAFHAHVTLARVKPRRAGAARELIGKYADLDYGVVDVERVHVMQSELTPTGQVYTPLEAVELAG